MRILIFFNEENGSERILCGVLVKELQESMDRCTGRCDMTEILLKTVAVKHHTINQSRFRDLFHGKSKFFYKIDNNHHDKNHSSLTSENCLDHKLSSRWLEKIWCVKCL